jgi:hypothetical protein
MNYLESRLRSWTPRPPSQRVKQRIFGGPPDPVASASIRHHTGWLVPAAACALIALLVLDGRESYSRRSLGSSPVVLMVSSNVDISSSLPRAATELTNAVLGLTNLSGPAPTGGQFTPFRVK